MTEKLKLAGVATSVFLMAAAGASAATMTAGAGGLNDGWASQITYDDADARGTSNNRDNPLNALGATDGAFFELGWGGTIDLSFGSPFEAPISIVEVTFGSLPNANYQESVEVWVGNGTGAGFSGSQVGVVSNNFSQGPSGLSLNFSGGPWSIVRLVDISNNVNQTATGGFDLDSVRVSPVPLPAAGFLLLAGLGGLASMRRRKKS